jgi:hypothetical protein
MQATRAVLFVAACICTIAVLVATLRKEKFSARDGEAALVCYWAPPPLPVSLASRQDPSGLAMPSRTAYSSLNAELSLPPSTIPPATNVTSATNAIDSRTLSTSIQQQINAQRLANLQEPLLRAAISPGMQNTAVERLPLPPTVPPTTKIPWLLESSIQAAQPTSLPIGTPPAFMPTPLAIVSVSSIPI